MIKASMSSGKVTLFHQDPQSEVTCRVPALLYILTDTLLAFTEKRSSARDEDAEYLVLRRSQKTGTSVEWGPTEPLTSAVLPAHRPMNPCPVYEQKSQTVFLFFICVRQRISEATADPHWAERRPAVLRLQRRRRPDLELGNGPDGAGDWGRLEGLGHVCGGAGARGAAPLRAAGDPGLRLPHYRSLLPPAAALLDPAPVLGLLS
ncbi:unnamed protein product [Caretta caretta]